MVYPRQLKDQILFLFQCKHFIIWDTQRWLEDRRHGLFTSPLKSHVDEYLFDVEPHYESLRGQQFKKDGIIKCFISYVV